MSEEVQALSESQKLFGVTFNPSKDPIIDEVKAMFVRLDEIVEAKTNEKPSYNANLIKGEAKRTLLDAQMWVVKHWTYQQ